MTARLPNDRQPSPETLAVSAGYDPATARGAAKPPAYLSSTFVYPSAAEAKAQAAEAKGTLELSGKAAVPASDPVLDQYRRKLSMALF